MIEKAMLRESIIRMKNGMAAGPSGLWIRMVKSVGETRIVRKV